MYSLRTEGVRRLKRDANNIFFLQIPNDKRIVTIYKRRTVFGSLEKNYRWVCYSMFMSSVVLPEKVFSF